MLILDQLKKADRPLQFLAAGVLLGILILMAGLYHVQIISRKKFEESKKIQSFRSVRVPAARGKIFDRHGQILGDNQPKFNLNLYIEDLFPIFRHAYTNKFLPEFRAQNGRRPKREENNRLILNARYWAVSNLVSDISTMLYTPLVLKERKFFEHYNDRLALPMPVFLNLPLDRVALFKEKGQNFPGVDLDVLSVRHYPLGGAAAHLVGYVQLDDLPEEDEEIQVRYSMPDFVGKTGMEGFLDSTLRGRPGVKSILVNSVGFRQDEHISPQPEPGNNVFLTVDASIQMAAHRAMMMSGTNTRGAAVVMDVKNGDVLAMVSAPTFDPNEFIQGISHEEWTRLSDRTLRPQMNRALQGSYTPGSIFKIIVALAALESGQLNPEATMATRDRYPIGRRGIGDTAPPGIYNFRRAFLRSSNFYFIDHGLKIGAEAIIDMGQRFHLGERSGIYQKDGQPVMDAPGYFPESSREMKKDGTRWQDGDTANLSIGQGELTVTPIQMAVMTSAVANGGGIFWPRLISRIESQAEPGMPIKAIDIPAGQIRSELKVNPKNLQIVREAMLADVDDPEGTGRTAFLPGMQVCGKTGTAQVRLPSGSMGQVTWFVSFAPFDNPKYAVVVMVEGGASGGGTCAPKAREIYRALQKREQNPPPPRNTTMAIHP